MKEDNKDILDFGLDFNIDIPEEGDDEFRIVSEKDYVPEWEEEVKRYMTTGVSGNLPKNSILYTHEIEPKDLDKLGYQRWCMTQIERCRDGYNGMCGKMYFYYNFCWIKSIKGKIRPQFRVIDSEWFRFVEACQKSKEWGIICVKRRRVGASWKEAADVLHDCLFETHFSVGMNSKTERDSQLLLSKVKFLYENLPQFLRIPTTKSNRKDYLDFSYVRKDIRGNKITSGNFSTILSVPPTDNAYEGQMLSKWVCDESGKIKNLATLWQYTEDCLYQETRRTGIPVLFGTAGDITEEGKDFEYMWRNAHKYKLKKFFFSGWMGMKCDEYGNDDKESVIRWIVYERHRREGLRIAELKTFIQKYPLTVPEAFTVNSSSGVGNIVKIKTQQQSLRENPAKKTHGFFRYNGNGSVDFVPDPRGQCIVYEHPQSGLESLYIAGCDPADHNDVFDTDSDLSLYVLKRQHGLDKPKIVFEYTDRPTDLTEYYEQAMMACIYYNKAKILIERNRYMMVNYFENSNHKYLLARTPVSVVRVTNNGRMGTYGIQMTPANKEFLKGLLADYIEKYYEFIPSYELLEEFVYFGAKNTDRAMAFGICLMLLQDYDFPVTTMESATARVPRFGFKNEGGRIVRVMYKPGEGPKPRTPDRLA